MKWLCQFGWHNWSRWECIKAQYERSRFIADVNARCCEDCGLYQVRDIY